jgi:hypothetical protein
MASRGVAAYWPSRIKTSRRLELQITNWGDLSRTLVNRREHGHQRRCRILAEPKQGLAVLIVDALPALFRARGRLFRVSFTHWFPSSSRLP